VGLGLELVEPCRSRPGGVGLGLIGFSRKYRRERNVIIKKKSKNYYFNKNRKEIERLLKGVLKK
jgi:hypothetical protein